VEREGGHGKAWKCARTELSREENSELGSILGVLQGEELGTEPGISDEEVLGSELAWN
jgi:hypothetical protein